MRKVIHKIYEKYPEQPFIDAKRDLELWEKQPELFPYGVVEKRQMVRLDEGVLPGDIIMLWRIHFDNFTTDSMIPQYFEYRYGVNSDESIKVLLRLGLIEIQDAKQSLPLLNMIVLKRILQTKQLDLKGKKEDIIKRINDHFSESTLAAEFSMRKYKITKKGSEVLNNHNDIIKRHGQKM